MGRERSVPGVWHQVHAHHEEASLSSLWPHAVQQMLESGRADPQVRHEQAAASVRDLLQRAAGRRELVTSRLTLGTRNTRLHRAHLYTRRIGKASVH